MRVTQKEETREIHKSNKRLKEFARTSRLIVTNQLIRGILLYKVFIKS